MRSSIIKMAAGLIALPLTAHAVPTNFPFFYNDGLMTYREGFCGGTSLPGGIVCSWFNIGLSAGQTFNQSGDLIGINVLTPNTILDVGGDGGVILYLDLPTLATSLSFQYNDVNVGNDVIDGLFTVAPPAEQIVPRVQLLDASAGYTNQASVPIVGTCHGSGTFNGSAFPYSCSSSQPFDQISISLSNFTFTPIDGLVITDVTTGIPEPTSLSVLGIGLLGLAGVRHGAKKARKAITASV